jgi:ABC-type phosphate transport system substrate-binding protein
MSRSRFFLGLAVVMAALFIYPASSMANFIVGSGTAKSGEAKISNGTACKKDKGTWSVTRGTPNQLITKVTLEECTKNSKAIPNIVLEQNYHQKNTQSLVGTTTIEYPEESSCKVEFLGSENENLKEATYENTTVSEKPVLRVVDKLKGIKYKTNGKCGELSEKEKTNTLEYEGTEESEGASTVVASECSNIVGSGSSLQNIAQKEVWIPGFTNEGGGWETACETKPTIEYKATSSGTALKEWGDEKTLGSESPFPAYIGTDVAPEGPATKSGTQMFNMDEAGEKEAGKPNQVMAIPVAQSGIAVIVSLPVGCTPKKTNVEAKVNNINLEKEWFEEKVPYTTLIETKESIELPKVAACEKAPILQAREKASGTTAGFKRYMNKIAEARGEVPSRWKMYVETPSKAENTTWPSKPVETKDPTGGELAKHVYEEPGQVGYADLADAEAQHFTKDPVEQENGSHEKYYTFMASVQSNGVEAKPEFKPAFTSNGGSNCVNATYEEPAEVAPNVDWSNAVDNNWNKNKSYPICTLTFDVAWEHYGYGNLATKYSENMSGFNTSVADVVNIVKPYLEWIVTKGESTALEENHYAKLPSTTQTHTEAGVKKSGNIGS